MALSSGYAIVGGPGDDGPGENTGSVTIIDLNPPLFGDADSDGMVGMKDVTAVLTFFGADYSPGSGPGDADQSGVVNFADVTASLTNWGAECP